MPRTLTVVADTAEPGAGFATFAPYVPAVDDRGGVTFQAGLRDGGTAVVHVDADHRRAWVARIPAGGTAGIAAIISHPDRAEDGVAWFYARLVGGGTGLVRVDPGGAPIVAAAFGDGDGDRDGVGPLGPTVASTGELAYRATVRGVAGVYGGDGHPIATGEGFEGLPIALTGGYIVFRGERGGLPGIWVSGPGGERAVAHGAPFTGLGRFPSAAGGRIALAGVDGDGEAGVWVDEGGALRQVVDRRDGFDAIRGALVDGIGGLWVIAQPPGGTLGVYGPDRVLGLGDPLFGERIADFALNPVSVADAGWAAARVALSDGRELVVRIGLARRARPG